MTLRPVSARWFEALVPRVDSARTAAILARTGAVEIDVEAREVETVRLRELETGLAAYRELVGRYTRYWARRHLCCPLALEAPPVERMRHALRQVEQWRSEADPRIQRLETLEGEQALLSLWKRMLVRLGERPVDFGQVADCGPVQDAVVAVLPAGARLRSSLPVLVLTVPMAGEQCLLAVGAVAHVGVLRQQVTELKGRLVERPSWLRGDVTEALSLVSTRLSALELEIERLYGELEAYYGSFNLDEALGELASLEWFVERVGALPGSQHFSRITGWTSDLDGRELAAALEWEGARVLIHFPPPPTDARPPQLLHNPWWVRPFEIFSRALGIPAGDEVDPSPWLAVVVPLLFGYMFGDIGHGLVLMGLGWALQRNWPIARLLIAGGLSAVLFGVLFGGIFCREDLIPPLWLHPLDAPLTVLAAPLGFAVVLLTFGQILNALQTTWRGGLQSWWTADAGFLVLYVGAAGCFLHPGFQVVALAGLVWYLAGHLWLQRSFRGAAGVVGSLLENGLRLSVNTVSFARVGAFALAHAGLSSAIVTLAEATTAPLPWWLIMVGGNLVIIGLEALVVSIQTTRLVLFEFFTRFLRAEGRLFRPLPPPPSIL